MAPTQLKVGIVGTLVLGSLTTALVLENHERARLRDGNSAIREELDRLRAENQRLIGSSKDEGELERSREERAELARLRGEVSALRRQNKELTDRLKEAASRESFGNNGNPTTTPVVSTFRTDVRANVESGQMLITGGWRTGLGKHMLLLMAPRPNFGGDSQAVLVESHFVDVPDQVLTALGLGAIATDANESSAKEVLAAADADSIVAKLRESEGVDFISSPRVLTRNGQQAQLQVTQQRMVDGTMHTLGPVINVVPTISSDGASVDVNVVAEVNSLVQTPRE